MHKQTYFDSTQSWQEFDRDYLWHPYTSMINPLPCYPVTGAEGAYIELTDGEKLLDGMSSWWSAIHGYNNAYLNEAMRTQAEKISHVMFGGIAHQGASELGARLHKLTDKAFPHIFLADSGSISIEVALKMALQYWQSNKRLQKNQFLTVRGGYHGDPFTCMSVGDPVNGQHHLFPTAIAKHHFVDKPECLFHKDWRAQDIALFKSALEEKADELAAVIIEPIVQGAGGMRFYHPQYLKEMRALCDAHDVLLIFDEIATGFGRTGKLFAYEHADIKPDIICLGKALTGGTMTMAATMATKQVAMGISSGEVPVLMHGPTFMANPLACAVACASIDLLMASGEGALYPKGWQAQITQMENELQALHAVADHEAVADVRVLGGIGVVEMVEPVDVATIQAKFVEEGVWVRPFGKLIYVMPPYILSAEQLQTLCAAIIHVITEA